MINRLSFNYDLNPAMLTDGFLWFKDLSAPDPYGILPLIGGIVSLLNILSTSTTTITPTMRKIRRYIYFLPLISVPIWMTFPAVRINSDNRFSFRHLIYIGYQVHWFI